MAKGNKSARDKKFTGELTKGFKDYEEVFDMLIDQAEQMSMFLLVKSIELSKEILKTYRKAWLMKAREKDASK